MALSMKQTLNGTPWWVWFLCVSIFILVISAGQFILSDIPFFWRLVSAFNIAAENNLAQWWSSMMLFAIGCIAYEEFSARTYGIRYGWLVMAILLCGLSFDELSSIHERVGSEGGFSAFIPYGIIILAMLVYTLIVFFKNKSTRKTALLICIAFILFGSVVVQEYIEHRFGWSHAMKSVRLVVEEGTELMAVFILCWAFLPHRQTVNENTLSRLIPNPYSFICFQAILLMLLVIHIVLSVFMVPSLSDLSHRGNPGEWYPVAIFFLLFCACFWSSSQRNGFDKAIVISASLLFLMFSFGSIYNIGFLLPKMQHFMPSLILENGFLFMYVLGLLIILVFLYRIKSWTVHYGIGILILIVLGVMSIRFDSIASTYVIMGTYAYVTAGMIMGLLYNIKKGLMAFPENLEIDGPCSQAGFSESAGNK